MTDKPSEWAMNVWEKAYEEWALQLDKETATKAAARVIDQARKQWEAEICEWLRAEAVAALGLVLDIAAKAIEDGDHLKSAATAPPASDTGTSGTGQPSAHKASVRGSEGE